MAESGEDDPVLILICSIEMIHDDRAPGRLSGIQPIRTTDDVN